MKRKRQTWRLHLEFDNHEMLDPISISLSGQRDHECTATIPVNELIAHTMAQMLQMLHASDRMIDPSSPIEGAKEFEAYIETSLPEDELAEE